MKRDEPIKLTANQILEKQTERGGYTRATLAEWGVPWPPTKGWKKALLEGKTVRHRSLRQTDIEDFIPNPDQEVKACEIED